MDAAANSHVDCVLHLLEFGASTILKNQDGKTALNFIENCQEGSKVDRDLISEYLGRPEESWIPLRQPEFIVEQVIEEAAAIYDQTTVDNSLESSNVSRNQSEEIGDKGKRRMSDGGNNPPLSANSNGGAYRDFSTKSLAAYWGTEDKPQASSGFSSTREERKFQALLKTLEKQQGGAGSSESFDPPTLLDPPRRKSNLYERKSTYRSDNDDDTVEVTTEKRGPYKKRSSIPPPIKVVSPASKASSASPSSAAGDTIKRKRGRPRKNPLPLDRLRSETDGDEVSATSGEDGGHTTPLKNKKRLNNDHVKEESDCMSK
jgi:hypothetical protein